MIRLRNRTAESARTSMWRSRWAAIGAAIAVSLGAGGMFVAQAAPGTDESTTVMLDTQLRILDTRDPVNVGLNGPFVSAGSQKLQVTGSVPTTAGTKTAVPTGATGVMLNVTSVGSTADGFISVRPGDATGAPKTSSLNVTAGVTVPNAVQVEIPTTGANAGMIDITWDALGVAGPTTDILIDVVAYMTNTGLQELVADVATKANSADVYTKSQLGAGFFARATGGLSMTVADQTVATLSLPAGTYVINATLVANNNSGGVNIVNCDLLLNGTAIDRTSSDSTGMPLGANTQVGSRESIALTGAGTVASAADVTVVCDASVTSGNYTERTITAIQVATLSQSAALDGGGAESSSTNGNE
jgi:hypothetical protein